MFKKILYPTDFSDVSERALQYIGQLKESGLEEVVILHVMDSSGAEAVRPSIASEEFELFKMKMKTEKEKSLAQTEELLRRRGLKVKTLIRVGVPTVEILKTESEEDVSVIVIGSHGASNVKEMLLGSVSEKVIRKCRKPVLVVKR